MLARDAGILVELKTWVAKEATDNGQVVDDSMLTDLAIFDRLDRDVEFRSVATRMVQRYGYLLPERQSRFGDRKAAGTGFKGARPHHGAAAGPGTGGAARTTAESERRQEQTARVERTACDPRTQVLRRTHSDAKGSGGSFQGDITLPDLTTPILPDQTVSRQFAAGTCGGPRLTSRTLVGLGWLV